MILVIKVNKMKLHDEEFVRPVTDLLENFKVVDYRENLDKFSWLKEFKKPVLGICAGMQIIGLILGKELIKNKRIGVFDNKYYLHSFSFKKDELKENNFTGYIYHPEVLNKNILIAFK